MSSSPRRRVAGRTTSWSLVLSSLAGASPDCWAQAVVDAPPAAVSAYRVVGDAIADPLSSAEGDADRGRTIVVSRQTGLCLLCHSGPFAEERFQGNLAPDLGGSGSRWSKGQLRLRLVDSRRLNPHSIMPAYHRIDGLTRVGTAWQGRTVLNAQQIEDVIAFLGTLRD